MGLARTGEQVMTGPEAAALYGRRMGELAAERETQPSTSVVEPEVVDHPLHYGGADNPYEAIKVIEAWGLGFHLGNAVKYICRAGKKGDLAEDLKKARFYIDRAIERVSS